MKCPSDRRVLVLCLVAATLLSLPGLGMGLFMDDYYHVAILEKLVPFGSVWSLFDFAPGDPEVLKPRLNHGVLPWFTLPEMKARFFRPLSCLLAAADHAVFGRRYVYWHLHSILWHLLLILAWNLTLRRVLPGEAGGVRALALVVFTLAPAHWFPVVWVANRNALVAVVPALLGLYLHIRWREDGFKWGLPLSLAAYAVGLSGGESSIGVLAYVAAYEVYAGPGTLPRRARSLIPAALLLAGYMAMYKALNYGAYGSGSYIDPLHEPVNYLIHAPGRVLMLIAALLTGFSADLLVFAEWLRPVHVIAGLATVFVFVATIRAAWPGFEVTERRALKWMTCGMLLSMLPVAATFPTDRLLLAASFGGSVILAFVLAFWWKARREGRARARLTALAVFLIAVHLAASPVMWVGQSLAFTWFGHRVERACLNAEMGDPLPAGGQRVLLPGCDPVTSIYTPIIRGVLEKRVLSPEDFWLVTSQAPHDHRLTTTHPDRIEIEVLGGSMLGSEFERLFRGAQYPLRVSEQIEAACAVVTILEAGDTGPSKIAIQFDRPIDDPSLAFLVWQGDRVRKTHVPPVGESIILPWKRGLLGLPQEEK